MHIDLSRRHAIVTGSTAGIGLAIASGLAAAGAHVVITGRTPARVDEAIASIARNVGGARLSGVAGDLGTREGAEHLIAQVPQTDILVNNLGIFEPKAFFEIADEDWRHFFEVNVMSGVRLARHYAQGMAQRGWGRVQFISSESGVQIPAEMVHYGTTKTAQLAVSRGLAESLAGHGFRLVSGGTDNHLMLVDLRSFDEDLSGKKARLVLDRAGISLNENTVPDDPRPPYITSGLRIGAPAVTTQGMGAREMREIAFQIHRVLTHREDEDVIAETRAALSDLCAKFAPYPD